MRRLIPALILILLAAHAALAVHAQSVSSIFSRYCGSCHNGVEADTLDEMIAKIRSWAYKYPTIDSAFRAAYGMGYAELMEKMRLESHGVPEQAYRLLYNYFIEVFREAAASQSLTPLPPVHEWRAETMRLCGAVAAAGLALAVIVVAYSALSPPGRRGVGPTSS